MADERKSQQDRSFEERLNQARKKADEAPSFEKADPVPTSPMGVAFKMGIELVVGSGVGAFIGFWFDKWFGTTPLFLIVLLIAGFASGIRTIVRDAARMQDDTDT